MKERTEKINVVLVGDDELRLFVKAIQGDPLPDIYYIRKQIIEEKYIIDIFSNVKNLIELIIQIYGVDSEEYVAKSQLLGARLKECQVVIYINPSPFERNFVEISKVKDNLITVEYDDKNVIPLECLHHIEILINQRAEKSSLVFQGYLDKESSFSHLPIELATYISALHYQVSSQHSAQSFFKPVAVLPQTEEEQIQEELFSQCSIQ